MIATVRIAPLEKWCDEAKKIAQREPQAFALIGKEVKIITQTARPATVWSCGGREWAVQEENAEQLRAEAGYSNAYQEARPWICEHMLEMD